MLLVTCLMSAVFVAGSTTADQPVSAIPAIEWAALPDDVRDAALRYARTGQWRERSKIGDELAPHGDRAVIAMLTLIRTTDNASLRRDGIGWLRRNFAQHAALKEFVLAEGLSSPDFSIRYACLWHVGAQKWDGGETRQQLFTQMREPQADEWLRFTAAK